MILSGPFSFVFVLTFMYSKQLTSKNGITRFDFSTQLTVTSATKFDKVFALWQYFKSL